MGRYYYPLATDALCVKKMFLQEHGYKIHHCFLNMWGTGYVLFDSKSDVNNWYKENTGEAFYKEEYEPASIFTKNDALREIEQSYDSQIDEVLCYGDPSMPVLAMGPSSSFGNYFFNDAIRNIFGEFSTTSNILLCYCIHCNRQSYDFQES
ncbi:MAG: hypothetical protein K2H86_02615 [Muribaculaceae bacterium]|nr:hypothetical protein [Muribaculaceae bacterium]